MQIDLAGLEAVELREVEISSGVAAVLDKALAGRDAARPQARDKAGR